MMMSTDIIFRLCMQEELLKAERMFTEVSPSAGSVKASHCFQAG